MFLAVALGAFGAHALKDILDDYSRGIYETGVHYHMIHGLAILLIALFADKFKQAKTLKIAGWLFLAGILFFSGSLYILAVTGVKVLGAITPIGGVCFLTGWLLLAYTAAKSR